MSTIRLEGLERLQARFERVANSNPQAAAAAAVAGAEHVRAVLQSQFLNGQAIGQVKHALATQWHVRGFDSPPGAILGTNVPYARAQEYGKQGPVSVRSYARRPGISRQPGESNRAFSKRRTAWQESREGSTFSITIQAHVRRMNLRPRRFLRGAIEASRTSLRRIVFEVWRRAIAG